MLFCSVAGISEASDKDGAGAKFKLPHLLRDDKSEDVGAVGRSDDGMECMALRVGPFVSAWVDESIGRGKARACREGKCDGEAAMIDPCAVEASCPVTDSPVCDLDHQGSVRERTLPRLCNNPSRGGCDGSRDDVMPSIRVELEGASFDMICFDTPKREYK